MVSLFAEPQADFVFDFGGPNEAPRGLYVPRDLYKRRVQLHFSVLGLNANANGYIAGWDFPMSNNGRNNPFSSDSPSVPADFIVPWSVLVNNIGTETNLRVGPARLELTTSQNESEKADVLSLRYGVFCHKYVCVEFIAKVTFIAWLADDMLPPNPPATTQWVMTCHSENTWRENYGDV